MKSRKLLALFLAIFMLASLIVPVSAEINPDVNDTTTSTTVGYDPSLVTVPNNLDDYDSITQYPADKTAGTVQEAYTISTEEEFIAFAGYVTTFNEFALETKTIAHPTVANATRAVVTKSVVVYLTADLDFEGATLDPVGGWTGSQWGKIGFAGIFDGLGHTIDNFKIEPENNTEAANIANGYVGVFRQISGGGVKNLIIGDNVTVTAGANNTGIMCIGMLAAQVDSNIADFASSVKDYPSITISNVYNKGTLYHGGGLGGGIVGLVKCSNFTMDHCTNAGNVITMTGGKGSGFNNTMGVGGLIGGIGEASKVYTCNATIQNSRNTGDVDSNAGKVGGIIGEVVGKNATTMSVSVDNCINNGNLSTTATVYVAGIIGKINKTSMNIAEVKNCKNYATTMTCGNDNKYVADIVGNNSELNLSLTGCTKGTIDPTYNMVAKYYQKSIKTYDNNGVESYTLRLVALHNGIEDYSNYGYDISITINGKTFNKSTDPLTTVNTGIAVDGKLGATEGENAVTVVSAAELGAQYVSAVCIDNIPVDYDNDGTNDKITVTITPKVNGTAISDPIPFEVPAYAA